MRRECVPLTSTIMSLLTLTFFREIFKPRGVVDSFRILPLRAFLLTCRHSVHLSLCFALLLFSSFGFESRSDSIRDGVYDLLVINVASCQCTSATG